MLRIDREKIKIYASMTDLVTISRRYFVIGFFDGVLTVMGMLIGAFLSNIPSEAVISAGIATSLALGISSGWGAFEAERVEQKVAAMEKRKSLLKFEDDYCLIDEAHSFAMKISAIVHAIAPIPAGIIPLIPYVFLPAREAFPYAVLIGLLLLFIVGVMLGRISKENVIKSGLRLVLAGILTLVFVSILNPVHL
ncbi:protein of unknown function DUF125 transmembrane [Ferroglobus placidus DSM 10642]|uniref:VIT family protein n=1 Tax=Ferroglobus placidus (strain DSM 10642 / AEDII12DO) TaxID=589924 RepID=D3S3F1_FERPA|nr:VIT1/CCC1 transporter family protein [Ferroglobus placidus]ADC64784.1 protein of unknown function DUF125 transmembrane [Ferroglobus placidus DSM 10642]